MRTSAVLAAFRCGFEGCEKPKRFDEYGGLRQRCEEHRGKHVKIRAKKKSALPKAPKKAARKKRGKKRAKKGKR